MNGTVFLTVAQAAEELGVSRQSVQNWIDEKRIHALWLLERWAIPQPEVERVKELRQQEKTAA